MSSFETKAYRVKFDNGDGTAKLAGIVDHPVVDPSLPKRAVAVFSHCFTCNKDLKSTVRLSRALAKSGVPVLRFDMTGLGGSEGDFSRTNFSTNRADLHAAIRFADRELGPVGALIGHSFGGVASLIASADAGDESCQLPLSDLGMVATIAAPSDTQHLAKLLARLSPEIEREGAGSVTIGGIRWTIEKQMLDDFRAHDVVCQLSKIRCPVLLIHSPKDETVSFDHAVRLLGLISQGRPLESGESPPTSLLSLDGADHLLTNNAADLNFVADVLASWCRRYAR